MYHLASILPMWRRPRYRNGIKLQVDVVDLDLTAQYRPAALVR
jgi:hypothetical protein